jgi:cytochrome d ubiquinol oxidase subunit I
MVALGMVFIGLTVLAAFYRWRGTLFQQRWLLAIFVVAVLGPYAANQAGWVAAEVGRQPWAVQNLLRTEHSVSSGVPGGQILGSILMFTVIYALLFAVWVYVLNHKIHQGPEISAGPLPKTTAEGLFSAAAGHLPGAGLSMTGADEDKPPVSREEG